MATPRTPRKRAAKVDQTKAAPNDGLKTQTADTSDPVVEDAVLVLEEPDKDQVAEEKTAGEPESEMTPDVSEPAPPPTETPLPGQDPATPAKPPSAPAQQAGRSGGFLGMLLGGFVAAAIGFGLARFVIPDGWPPGAGSARQDAIAQNAAAIAELDSKINTLTQAAPSVPAADMSDELSAIRNIAAEAMATAQDAKDAAGSAQDASDLTSRLAAIEERIGALEQRPASEAGADVALVGQLANDVQSLKAELDAQKASAEKAAADMAAAAEAAKAEAEAEATATLLRASLAQVEAALQSGAPYAGALQQLSDAGIAIPPALTETAEDGAPTVASLTEGFAQPARLALEASLRANMGDTMTERLGSFLRSQTGARSLTPQEGDDPDAILSRIEAATAAGDLQKALEEAATLPEPAQTALAEWVTQVQHRIATEQAALGLAAELGER